MIYITPNLVLTSGDADGVNGNNPLVGYDNLVPTSTVVADTTEEGFSVVNLQNPATNLRWQGVGTVEQHVEFYLPASLEQIDYVAIARHNFATAGIAVSIEGATDLDASPIDWFELTTDVLLGDDGPALFRFEPQALAAVRIRMQAGTEAPRISVAYVGKLLVIQRRIYVGHTPINLGVSTRVTNAKSENGEFLGRVVLSEMTSSNVQLRNLWPDWVRDELMPWIESAQEAPFFFAWRPGDYPLEVGYAWMTNDPRPSNQASDGRMQCDFSFTGIA